MLVDLKVALSPFAFDFFIVQGYTMLISFVIVGWAWELKIALSSFAFDFFHSSEYDINFVFCCCVLIWRSSTIPFYVVFGRVRIIFRLREGKGKMETKQRT